MREIRKSGSEGGGTTPELPTPIVSSSPQSLLRQIGVPRLCQVVVPLAQIYRFWSFLFGIGGCTVATCREQALVTRPQPCSADQHDGAEQVDIYRTQPTSPELTPIHQRHYFLRRQDREPLEVLKEDQHTVALLDRPERQFLDHSRMTSDQVVTEKRNKRRLGGMEVVNPDRSIDQDHLAPSRRRGAAVA